MPARLFRASTATGDSQRHAPSTIWRAQTSNTGRSLSARDYSTNSGANGVKWLWRTTELRGDGRGESREGPAVTFL
jgi:hypothetical protein